MNEIKRFLGVAGLLALALPTYADMITYDTWSTNEGGSGNYIVTVDDNTAGRFTVVVTVDPWNAEVLGLFVDFGDFDLPGSVDLSTLDAVLVSATDTSSNNHGPANNLNGLNPPLADPDSEWEIVFRLGDSGYEGLQTFMFSINDFGLMLGDWGVIGIRAQVYCGPGDTLPDDNENCDGSDKSYGFPGNGHMDVTEPGTLALLGLGLLGLSFGRRRRV